MSQIHNALENLPGPEKHPEDHSIPPRKTPFFQRKIVLTVDNVIAIVILNIALLSLIYPYGVYHGRNLKEQSRPEATKSPVIAQLKPQPAAAAPEMAAAAAEKTSFYTIQLGSYGNEDLARKASVMISQIKEEKIIVPSGKYVLLCVGNFGTQAEAKRVFKDLKQTAVFKKTFRDAYIRQVKSDPGKIKPV